MCVLDDRCPSIIIADTGEYLCTLCGGIDCFRFGWIPSDGFFTENVFSCGCRCLDDLKVHAIRGSDVDYLYVFVIYDVSIVGRCALKSETCFRLGCAFDNIICTNDEFRLKRTVMEPVVDLLVCAGVRHTHPSHADNADTYCVLFHFFNLLSSWTAFHSITGRFLSILDILFRIEPQARNEMEGGSNTETVKSRTAPFIRKV